MMVAKRRFEVQPQQSQSSATEKKKPASLEMKTTPDDNIPVKIHLRVKFCLFSNVERVRTSHRFRRAMLWPLNLMALLVEALNRFQDTASRNVVE